MNRVLSLAILATFLTGPALRLECLVSCAAIEEAAPRETCHSEAGAGTTVAAGTDHCADEGIPAALTAKRSDAQSLAGMAPSDAVAGSPSSAWVIAASRARASLIHPPPRPLIPLRI